MKKATFENSVNVLVRAYLNDTLDAGDCKACAVGNLIQHACNIPPNSASFYPDGGSWYSTMRDDSRLFKVLSEHPHIVQTGYTGLEIYKIERAFMTACSQSIIDDNFERLLAVVDVLAEIHSVDLTVKEQAVGRFQEVHETKAI